MPMYTTVVSSEVTQCTQNTMGTFYSRRMPLLYFLHESCLSFAAFFFLFN